MDFAIEYSVKIVANKMFPSKVRQYSNVNPSLPKGLDSFDSLLEQESDRYLAHIYNFASVQGCWGVKDFDLIITIERTDIHRTVERNVKILRSQYMGGSGVWGLNAHIQDILRSMLFALIVG